MTPQPSLLEDDSISDGSAQDVLSQLNARRHVTFPYKNTSARRKPRRWPLVLRFIKGAIHSHIVLPVILHAMFTALVVSSDLFLHFRADMPPSIVPSLSIVVGLMLVFRNQSSYSRFWDGRNNLTAILTSLRNLTRSFLCCSYKTGATITEAESADIERTVRVLMALPSTIKNSLRSEWGAAWAPITSQDIDRYSGAITPRLNPEYAQLLPLGLKGHEEEGLSLPIELTTLIESFIKRGHDRGWFHAPQASQMTVQLNTLVDAYGKMETIRFTSYPIAIMIHQRQVLALFGAILPLAIVEESHWWSILIVSLVMFTLYGIEAIASQLEDPFGYDRNDINMDAIVEDARIELSVMLSEWKRSNEGPIRKQMFMEEM
ncbi:hypothetical protein LTR51_005284 [Lithohypha guttulata]|nr:hypothetical protein LTR51_005284 [Lithohypha guttulata]